MLDVKSLLVEEHVVVGFGRHLIDDTDSSVQIVVLVHRLEETTERAAVRLGSDLVCLELIECDGQSKILESVSVDLILLLGLRADQQQRCNHVLGERLGSHLHNVEEVRAVELRVSQDGSEKAGVRQILIGEGVDKQPVQEPSHRLDVLLA